MARGRSLEVLLYSSRFNEPVSRVVEWKAALQAATPQEAETTTITVTRKLMKDICKRKIFESAKVDQSYKFKKGPLVERVALEIDAKK